MEDDYSKLRAAFHAGATIQAYTVKGEDGSTPLMFIEGESGAYWRDLSCDGEPKFSCHHTRYRVKPEDAQTMQSRDGVHWEPAVPVSAREVGAWSLAYRIRLWFRRLFKEPQA